MRTRATTRREARLKANAKPRVAFNPQQLTERIKYRRAVEAVIWGMAAVNTERMRRTMLERTSGKINHVLLWSRPADAMNQTLTPNPDAIYLMSFYDTTEGPIVLEIPPAEPGGGSFAGNVVDVWQMPIDDVGPAGADKGKGGKYLITPPAYERATPPGYIALPSNTYSGYALLRSNLKSHSDDDIAAAVAYGMRIRVYPLPDDERGSARPTQFADAAGILFDSTIPYDDSFFHLLNNVVQHELWLERDRAMIDQLKSIGIEKGKPFAPDAKTTSILNDAASEARAWLDAQYETVFPPYWSSGQWFLPISTELRDAYTTAYGDSDSYPVDDRGLAYTYAFIGIKRLGAAQFYVMAIRDREGNALDGGASYRLHIPANVPAAQYWSATVYDRDTHTLLQTTQASRASNDSGVRRNDDGSVDLYFGRAAPPGKESNWVPTLADREFEVLFRLYGPENPLLDKTWSLPDIEKIT